MAVVCGTDFSEFARSAVSTAAALAARRGEELFVVHVLDPSVHQLPAETQAQLEATARRKLDEEARRVADQTKVRAHPAVLSGRPEDQLRAFSLQKQASLAVVASLGQVGSPPLTVGAVSERLALGAPLPLLVVRDPEPFEHWTGGRRPLRLVVGVDDTAVSDSAVRFVEGLRAVAPVDVLLCRVYSADEGQRRYGLGWRLSRTEVDPELQALVERDLQRRYPRLSGEGEVVYRGRLGVGNVGDHLLELAESERADLLVLGSRGRRGLGRLRSISAHVLHLARTSVAVVPKDAATEAAPRPTPRFCRVLAATDFSVLGDSAIPYAYALAEPDGGEVTLAHVTSSGGLARDLLELYFPVNPDPAISRSELERELTRRLRALTPRLADERRVVTRTAVLTGPEPARALLECAARIGADVIVLTSHGRGGVSRALTGSVAEAVLRHARCPVFVVRPSTASE